MANYYASCRSNYFKVKDIALFKKEILSQFAVDIYEKDGLVTILGADLDGSGWPVFKWDEEEKDHVEVDFFLTVSEYLTDDSVAIFMEVGAEKLRYLVGYAVAINSKGYTIEVNLDHIYKMVQDRFKITPTQAHY